MTDPIRQNAIAKRNAALAEAARWEEFLSMLDEVTGRSEPTKRSVQYVTDMVKSVTEAAPPSGGLLSMTEAVVVAILRERGPGATLTTRELLDLVVERGVDVRGTNQLATLSSRLSRSSAVENIRPLGWRLRATDAEETGAAELSFQANSAVPAQSSNDADGPRGGGT